jgi:hypothetical protein
MSEHNDNQRFSRRGFFRRIATLAGAVGAVAVVRTQKSSQPAAAEAASVEKPGYRVTEHVRKYYQKARTV